MTEHQELAEIRQQKDLFFKTNPQSPIPAQERGRFGGLAYYDPNPDLDLMVEVEEFEEKQDIQMQTSSGELRDYQRWGQFSFQAEGQTARLTLYFRPQTSFFFLPFTDVTSGKETYGAGRYVDAEALGGNKFRIDFNLAYHPYCAYNPGYSCPIPPQENRLSVPIRAGEKNPPEK